MDLSDMVVKSWDSTLEHLIENYFLQVLPASTCGQAKIIN